MNHPHMTLAISINRRKKNQKRRALLSLVEVLVSRARRCQSASITRDEVARPQTTEGLVSENVAVAIKVRHDAFQIGATFGKGGVPEPELRKK